MTRLSLSPEPEEWQQGRYRLRDDGDSSSEDEFVPVSHDDCEYSDSDDEDYPHPVGFSQGRSSAWGRTRFCLDPSVTADSIEEQWQSQIVLFPTSSSVHRLMQSYPPVESYIDAKTASTVSLLRYDESCNRKSHMQKENDREMDQITQLLQAASLVDTVKAIEGPPASQTPLALLANTANEIKQKMAKEELRAQRDHEEAAMALKKLIKRTQDKAEQILQAEEARERAEIARLEEEQAEEDERQRLIEEKKAAENQAIEDQKEIDRIAQQKIDDARTAKREEAAKKVEYITKANKLVAQLEVLQKSIEPFEKSKAVGKRRLNMKKVVRGKVNTLAENADKIKEVAAQVGQAIAEARAEDEELKKQLQAGNTQITPEMPRGKRYLLDLLASSIRIRVQAEGFNGLRGDGFPMANMLALISLENKELVPILAAHIYTVCPTAIPKLPSPTSDASEEALMKSLGMAKDKKGEYETFDRFLSRTEGIISLVADIMASNPPQHQLMGGHKGAVEWLERFIEMLPAAPHSPLPLLTAPVLDAFLTGAGHMLANKHGAEFQRHLEVIQNDIVNRLDEGPIGTPSATRLKKTVHVGFDGFKNNLPSKALKELYYGADGSDGQVSIPTVASSSPFGSNPATNAAPPNPFGGKTASGSSGPFGISSSGNSSAPNPFGGPNNANSGPASSSPFGASTSNSNSGQGAPNPFGGQPSSSTPFGQHSAGGMGGGNNSMQDNAGANQTANPFGGQPSMSNPSPFGASSAPGGAFGSSANTSTTPFGNSSMNAGSNTGSTPFGASSGGFGAAPAASAGGFGQSGFGASNNMNSSGGFGSSNANPSPFGAATANAHPSPFGAPANNASPFGSAPAPSGGAAFGSSQPSGFGAFGGGNTGAPASGFGSSPFGGSSNNQQQTPFGGGGNNQQQTPFGGGGNNQQQTPFGGGGSNQQGSQGGKDNRPPCKFFAKGNCRFGNNCRFSHNTQGGGGGNTQGGGFGGGNNNGFGRRF